MTPINFHYLNLGSFGGRGGVVRFFLLASGIPMEETLYDTSAEVWGVEKKRLIDSGDNPCGTLPVVYTNDNNGGALSQHIAICRYIARSSKLDTGDALQDYVQDLVADEYQASRNHFLEIAFGATISEEQKTEYRTKTVPEMLSKFEALYQKHKKTASDVPYLSTSPAGSPLWGDAAMFGLTYDHKNLGYITEETLESYPNLSSLYKAFASIPAVAEWIASKAGK